MAKDRAAGAPRLNIPDIIAYVRRYIASQPGQEENPTGELIPYVLAEIADGFSVDDIVLEYEDTLFLTISPLLYAVLKHEFEPNDDVQTLLALGVNPNKEEKYEIITEFLYQTRAVRAVSKVGTTPFHQVILNNNLDLAKLFLSTCEIDELRKPNSTILSALISRGDTHFDMLHLVLNKVLQMTDVNFYNEIPLSRARTGTLLQLAAFTNNDIALSLLLRSGANIHATNNKGETALHIAVQGNASECIRLLLAAKAKVNVADLYGWTPLHNAVKLDSSDIAKQLLEAGANPNAQDSEGLTPFGVVAVSGQGSSTKAILRLLLNAGADIHLEVPGSTKKQYQFIPINNLHIYAGILPRLIAESDLLKDAAVEIDMSLSEAAFTCASGEQSCISERDFRRSIYETKDPSWKSYISGRKKAALLGEIQGRCPG